MSGQIRPALLEGNAGGGAPPSSVSTVKAQAPATAAGYGRAGGVIKVTTVAIPMASTIGLAAGQSKYVIYSILLPGHARTARPTVSRRASCPGQLYQFPLCLLLHSEGDQFSDVFFI